MLIEDYNPLVLEAVKHQTVPVSDLIVCDIRGCGVTLSEQISDALNKTLADVDLQSYDYILRVDADTVLPPRFLESNLALGAAVVGYGHAHLFRVDVFLDLMDGKFHPVSDDSYLNYKFQAEGYKWSYWSEKPYMLRRAGQTHDARYFLIRGHVMYVNGYEPFHVLGSPRWEWKNILCWFSYFADMLRRKPRLDVAKYVFWFQLRKLRGDLRRKQRF